MFQSLEFIKQVGNKYISNMQQNKKHENKYMFQTLLTAKQHALPI